MSNLIQCHFTLEELEYLNLVIMRERALSDHLEKNLQGLEMLGVKLQRVPQPNIIGKLLSYIQKGRDNEMPRLRL